jgi:hypothetical protein
MQHPNKRPRESSDTSHRKKQKKNSSKQELTVELWRQIVGLLPPAYLYSLSVSGTYPTYMSDAARHLGFNRRGFAVLEPERQLTILRDLYTLKYLKTLKCLLRLTKMTVVQECVLGQGLAMSLLEEPVRRNDEDLACLVISKSKSTHVNNTIGLVLAVKYPQDDLIAIFSLAGRIPI